MRRLGQELDRTGLGALLEQLDDFGCPHLELLECGSRDRIGDSESAFMATDQIKDLPGRRHVTLVGHLAADLLVRIVVEVERMIIEDRILSYAERLMNLEVEADAGHVYRIANSTKDGSDLAGRVPSTS